MQHQFTASDVVFLASFPASIAFLLAFVLGPPRSWLYHRLGWVVALYALAVVELLGLIVYGVVLGQRVDEGPRLVVGLTLFFALVAKITILYVERHEGRREKSNTDERKDRDSVPRP